MEVREELKEIIERARAAAEAAGELPPGEYAPVQRLEIPKAKEFGDYSTNAAMQWARTAHKAPRAIAESIVKYIDAPLVSKMEIAGAGFINFFLAADTVYAELRNILSAGASYGDPCGICVCQSYRTAPYRARPRRGLWFCSGEPAPRGGV